MEKKRQEAGKINGGGIAATGIYATRGLRFSVGVALCHCAGIGPANEKFVSFYFPWQTSAKEQKSTEEAGNVG